VPPAPLASRVKVFVAVRLTSSSFWAEISVPPNKKTLACLVVHANLVLPPPKGKALGVAVNVSIIGSGAGQATKKNNNARIAAKGFIVFSVHGLCFFTKCSDAPIVFAHGRLHSIGQDGELKVIRGNQVSSSQKATLSGVSRLLLLPFGIIAVAKNGDLLRLEENGTAWTITARAIGMLYLDNQVILADAAQKPYWIPIVF
jgi:hypothetical protein